MVQIRSALFTLGMATLLLFVIANVLSELAGLNPVYALFENIFGSLQVNYYLLTPSLIDSPFILAANFMDSIVFALMTVILAAWFFNLINNLSISERIMLSRAKRAKDHVILAPYTPLAEQLLDDLKRAGIKAVVITEKKGNMQRLYRSNNLAVVGDVRSTDVFLTAGISRARYVIACSEDDLQNTLITVTAKNASPGIKVIARVSDEADIPKLSIAGAYMTVKPEIAAGEKVAGELLKRLV